MQPREFTTVDRKQRMQLHSQGVLFRPASERIQDFDDVLYPVSEAWARAEAARCIHCADPAPCHKACPGGNDISYAMWLIEQGDFLAAARLYRQNSFLPDVCGRVCPHEKLCEGHCVRGKKDQLPVPTGALEAFVTSFQRQHEEIVIEPGKPTGKTVAVVGAGPTGLSCAEALVRLGHQITVFDAWPAPGGLMTYGIPNFKLPKQVVFGLWGDLERAGVKFVGNTYIGPNLTIDDLLSDGFDAVYLGIGTTIDARPSIPGEELPGVYLATDFLVRGNVEPEMRPEKQQGPLVVGDRVVVIGGGDTGADCLRTALRLGAKEVVCIYRRTEKEMPGGYKDRKLAIEEGAQYHYLIQPVRFIPGQNGRLSGIECVRTELGDPDPGGRSSFNMIDGTNFVIDTDTAVLAIGYWPDPTLGDITPELETHKWGLIKVIDQETGATTKPGVFAGGDGVIGPDLVVTAMVAGKKAAAGIDRYLSEIP